MLIIFVFPTIRNCSVPLQTTSFADATRNGDQRVIITAPTVKKQSPSSEPHPTFLDLLEESMESNASVVHQDHCYTLPPSVSLHSAVASLGSSDITSSSQPESSSTDACSPAAAAASYDTVKLPSYSVKSLKLVWCPHCSLRLYKKNLSAHIQNKHAGLKDITAASHLKNVCVDETQGIFAVQKVARGFSVPIHVQRKTWGNHHQESVGWRNVTSISRS